MSDREQVLAATNEIRTLVDDMLGRGYDPILVGSALTAAGVYVHQQHMSRPELYELLCRVATQQRPPVS